MSYLVLGVGNSRSALWYVRDKDQLSAVCQSTAAVSDQLSVSGAWGFATCGLHGCTLDLVAIGCLQGPIERLEVRLSGRQMVKERRHGEIVKVVNF